MQYDMNVVHPVLRNSLNSDTYILPPTKNTTIDSTESFTVPLLDGKKLSWLWKLLLFNAATVTVYWAMIHLLGMAALAEEFAQAGRIMTAVTLAMGNVLFVLLDFALRKLDRRFFKK